MSFGEENEDELALLHTAPVNTAEEEEEDEFTCTLPDEHDFNPLALFKLNVVVCWLSLKVLEVILASNDDDETVDDADGDVTLILGELLSEDIYCVNDDLTPGQETSVRVRGPVESSNHLRIACLIVR